MTYDNITLITILVGLFSSVVVGIIKSLSTTVDTMHPLIKQGLVLLISAVGLVGLHFFDISTLPVAYSGAVATIIQAIVAAMSGIALHNVKDAATKGEAGVH